MRIAFLGDIAFIGKNSAQNSECWKRFGPIKRYLKQYDYVVANLESPLTSYSKNIGGKSAYLKGHQNDAELLDYLHVTHVTLANNHMFDYRAQGLEDTIQALEKQGIQWYGINNKAVTITHGNNSLLLMGYCCYSTNGKGLGGEKPYINALDPIQVEQDVSRAIKMGMLPILSIHWGQEHVHYPNYDHVKLARKLCKNQRILIHGHHPHVIQGIEKIEESLVAYSLGNFCFDDVYTPKSKAPLVRLSNDNKESFILVVELRDNSICDYQLIPFSFAGEAYQVDNSILDRIQEWSSFLNVPKDDYIKKRSDDLSAYISKRKELRSLEWYLKRLNCESVKMIVASKKNFQRYNQLIKRYVSDEEGLQE